MRLPIWRAALWKWEPPAKDWLASSSCEAFHLMRVGLRGHTAWLESRLPFLGTGPSFGDGHPADILGALSRS